MKSVAAGWETRLVDRLRVVPLPEEKLEAAKRSLETSRKELAGWLAGLAPDLNDYRLELARLADQEATRAAAEVPFERERVAKKRRELSAKASAWMTEAAAIGRRLEADWDADLAAADRDLSLALRAWVCPNPEHLVHAYATAGDAGADLGKSIPALSLTS